MTEHNQPSAQDGFDLIEYPCEFAFKAMCQVVDGVDLEKQLSDLVVGILNQQALLSVKSTQSRTGKYESFTLTVSLASREQLETVYQAIADSDSVVMTL